MLDKDIDNRNRVMRLCNSGLSASSHLIRISLYLIRLGRIFANWLYRTYSTVAGVYVWDVKGCSYMDFYCGGGSVCLGHCRKEMVTTMIKQALSLTITSPAFHSDIYPMYAEYITKYFGYDKVLPQTSGGWSARSASFRLPQCTKSVRPSMSVWLLIGWGWLVVEEWAPSKVFKVCLISSWMRTI